MKKGFTLIEMLVVVLIIGILAGIALPQYQMAVTKAKVASMLPLMRRWKDALAEYKLQHGDYCIDAYNGDCPDANTLGVNWPSDWNDGDCGDSIFCSNDYWDECIANEEQVGEVVCKTQNFWIEMHQPDDELYEELQNKTVCLVYGEDGEKICKALGGKKITEEYYQIF